MNNLLMINGQVHAPGKYFRNYKGYAPRCQNNENAFTRHHLENLTDHPVSCGNCKRIISADESESYE